MFEIPDDDADINFWDIDVPVTSSTAKVSSSVAGHTGGDVRCRSQLRVPDSICTNDTTKTLYTAGATYDREASSSPPPSFVINKFNTDKTKHCENVPPRTPVNMNINNIQNVSRARKPIDSVSDINKARPGTSHHATPRRKRKFPGPAGLLPQLAPGDSLENTPNIPRQISPKDDSPIPCSQTSDQDIFSDTPWLTLMTDLGEDGAKLMKKFAIATTLLKSGKKQLDHGKALLIFGVIETLDSHGSEASVTIKDKSGKMQGTVHRDLLKEYESDLQVGTVLVLKQVSIISLSSRNHYLNITPNNIVALYHNRQAELKSLKFHGSQDSLNSVLVALENKAQSHRQRLNSSGSLTPSSLTGSSRLSSTNTPILTGGTPSTPALNQRLFQQSTQTLNGGMSSFNISRQSTPAYNQGTPNSSHQTPSFYQATSSCSSPGDLSSPSLNQQNHANIRTPSSNVRDVSVVKTGQENATANPQLNYTNDRSVQRKFNFNTPNRNQNHSRAKFQPSGVAANLKTNQNTLNCSDIRVNTTTSNNARVPGTSAISSLRIPIQHVECSHDNLTTKCASTILHESSKYNHSAQSPYLSVNNRDLRTSDINMESPQMQSTSNKHWKFKSPTGRTPLKTSTISPNLDNMAVNNVKLIESAPNTDRSCQLAAMDNKDTNMINNDDNKVQGKRSCFALSQSKWSFKSPSLGSPHISSPVVGRKPGTDNQALKVNDNIENLWEDDLSDELLSQLSEEMNEDIF